MSEERKPLLGEENLMEAAMAICDRRRQFENEDLALAEDVALGISRLYENLIDTGVLMVVKTAHVVQVPFIPREGLTIAGCSICGKPGISTTDQFCPGCGSKFTTAPASPSKSHPK